MCIIREFNQIEGRKNAREFRAVYGKRFEQRHASPNQTQSKSVYDFQSSYSGSPLKKGLTSGLSPQKGKQNNSGLNESTETGKPRKNTSILKDGEGGKRTAEKTVRMEGQAAKSVHSGADDEPAEISMWRDKTADEIQAGIDQKLDQINKLLDEIKALKDDNKTPPMQLKNLIKPLDAARIKLQQEIRIMDQIREDNIEDHEKLPKDSDFYKHFMNNIYTSEFMRRTAHDSLLKEVGQTITRLGDYETPEKAKRAPRQPSQREREAMKTLWQELSA